MEKLINKIAVTMAFFLALGVGLYANGMAKTARAEDGDGKVDAVETTGESDEEVHTGTSISITPVSKILTLDKSSVYEDKFEITNGGAETVKFEVHAAPYSYFYSEENDSYSLGFSKENNYTQITRWITIKDESGNWVENPTFTVKSKETVEVSYKISTPSDIPAGGQYAVLFAHTISDAPSDGRVRTEASPGLVIYGHAVGETNISSEIKNLSIDQWVKKDTTEEGPDGTTIQVTKDLNHIFATAKVKNTGNVDFNAIGKLKVEGILGGASYETPSNRGRVSIIPETELAVSDEWEDTPAFGIFKVTWTVTAGEQTETISAIIAINIAPLIIFLIILLTFAIVGTIIGVKKRKERRSRFTV